MSIKICHIYLNQKFIHIIQQIQKLNKNNNYFYFIFIITLYMSLNYKKIYISTNIK